MRRWAGLIENVFFNLVKKLGAFICLPTAWKSYMNSEKILRQIGVWAPVKRYLCLLLEMPKDYTDDGFVNLNSVLNQEARTEATKQSSQERIQGTKQNQKERSLVIAMKFYCKRQTRRKSMEMHEWGVGYSKGSRISCLSFFLSSCVG